MIPLLSRLSVRNKIENRLRHRCSSTYLRISPLLVEFRFLLLSSRDTVSNAVLRLSPRISHLTYHAAYAPFTPSDSEQRLGPSYYRGCWHEVSRCLFFRYRQNPRVLTESFSFRTKELYNPKAFFTHAAWLDQACAHCPIFPTAASRRSLDRVSVPVWPTVLSDRLLIKALVSHYLTN